MATKYYLVHCYQLNSILLSQVRAGHRPAHAWFLEIDSVQIVSMCVCLRVCPPQRLLITSGVMWRDIDPIRLIKQLL